jgi:tetratricopeptide (TPR) repeat protein
MAVSDKAQLCYLRGQARLGRGDYAGAVAEFSAALGIDPGSGELYRKRGSARRDQGDAAGAVADFDAALRIDPQDAEAYRGRSSARLLVGDVAGAEADARQALALRPCAEAHAMCGAVRQCGWDFAAAVAHYSRAIEANPRLFWPYLMRGNAHYHLGTLAETCADYRRAFRLDPDLAAGQIVRLLLREIGSGAASALAACDEHLRRHPDDFLTCGRRGVLLLLLGRDDEARADLDAFRVRSPQDAGWLQRVIDGVLRRRPKTSGTRPAGAAPADREACVDEIFARAAVGGFQL